MSNNASKRRGLKIAKRSSPWTVFLGSVKKTENWFRFQLLVITGVILWAVSGGWAPPFSYRARMVPQRDMNARVRFDYPDLEKTKDAKEKASRGVPCFYENDPARLEDLKKSLIEKIFELKDKPFEEIDPEEWRKFYDPEEAKTIELEELEKDFESFRTALTNDDKLEQLEHALEISWSDFEETGLLTTLQHGPSDGSMVEIRVIPAGTTDINRSKAVEIAEVRIPVVADELLKKLETEFKNLSAFIKEPERVAARISQWMRPMMPETLKYNDRLTGIARDRAENSVSVIRKIYEPGDPLDKQNITDDNVKILAGGVPLDEADVSLLYAEHLEYVKQMDFEKIGLHILSDVGMYVALLGFLCLYLYYRDIELIEDTRKFSTLLGLFLIAICAAWLLAMQWEWRAEIIPLTFFAMTVAIAMHREIAVVMSAIASLVFTVSHGYQISDFVILVATTATASLLCGTIRSRTKLIYVGLISAAVAFPTVIGVSVLTGQSLTRLLWLDAIWYGSGAILSGVLMTALLPFLERWFDLETDISLLELSDANHPILKELVQRAPGTYNHSINVASIAEAAAKSIGANGLLCRVGAYFHDIGKMRKPEYFIENQIGLANKHEDLVPTMSTIVIISHVKDGVELARNHNLPPRIVDLIEQHHGTTLVEYFFNQAKKQSSDDNQDVEKSDFRYPGPKPQTAEAAVMMIADAVESASRTLREPAPARLDALVSVIMKKKLDDGQFDECPVTMQQLNMVQKSLVKSLNAIYHARVQYPEQESESPKTKPVESADEHSKSDDSETNELGKKEASASGKPSNESEPGSSDDQPKAASY